MLNSITLVEMTWKLKGTKTSLMLLFLEMKLIYYFYALFIYPFTRFSPKCLTLEFLYFIDILMQFIFSFSD